MNSYSRKKLVSTYESRLKPVNSYERQQMYQLHRIRVQNMKSKVDSQAPPRDVKEKPREELPFVEMMTSIRNAVQCSNEPLTFTKSPDGAHNKVRKLRGYGNNCSYKAWHQQQPHQQYQMQQPAQQSLLFYHHEYDTHSQTDEREERRKYNNYNIASGISDPLLVRYANQQQKFSPDRLSQVRARSVLTTQHPIRIRWKENRIITPPLPLLPPVHRIRERGGGGDDTKKHSLQYYNWNGVPVHPANIRQQQQHQQYQQQQCERTDSSYSMTQPASAKERDEAKRNGIPVQVLQRYQYLTGSHNIPLLRKLLRPKIFLDLEVKHLRPLGRLVIQLFTEACPEVVLEFVRICTMQTRERFHFTRLFPPMWMEGELALTDNKTLTGRSIEHDTTVLDHGSGAGILSFPSRYVRGSKRPFLSFSISFKPLKVLNGKRIAFGKVRRGNWILDAIQDYGTNSGKPLKEIVVTRCGLLQ